MQGKIKRSAQLKIYVGIDVSKAWLDVAIIPTNTVFRVANNTKGYKALAKEALLNPEWVRRREG